jgi:mRNA deadenylase 3'-5' endonuclease subunit Ccr4
LIDFWLEYSIKLSDNDGKHTSDERISALGLISDIWLAYTDLVDSNEETSTNIIAMFKKGIRDKYRPVRVVSISMLFRILEKFSEEKNPSAPAIYKTIIFSLCENPSDSIAR